MRRNLLTTDVPNEGRANRRRRSGTRTLPALLVGALAIGLTLTGCSKSDDSEGSETASATTSATSGESASADESADASDAATSGDSASEDSDALKSDDGATSSTTPSDGASSTAGPSATPTAVNLVDSDLKAPAKPAGMTSGDLTERLTATGEYLIDLYVYMEGSGNVGEFNELTPQCAICAEESAFFAENATYGNWNEQQITIKGQKISPSNNADYKYEVNLLVYRAEAKYYTPDGLERTEEAGDFTVVLGMDDVAGGPKVREFIITSPDKYAAARDGL